ncbi:MAG: caspase family protein [Proteobacteria bacterium]|nr:caspase family protein [Pseudomonadota bacterium]MBU4066760.1 caspase family protein [Pseudomonadota bacterium]
MTGCATPLMNAAISNDIKKMETLLNEGVDIDESVVGNTALSIAVLKGSLETVRFLLDKGADVNKTSNGWKPIHLAVLNGNARIVKLLLDKGADVTAISPLNTPLGMGNKTPLRMAEEKGYSVIARMLREAEQKEYKNLYAKETKESDQKSEKIPRRETSKPTIVKSDVDELPQVQAKPNKNAYAIVIGIEEYRQKLPKADYADNDARIMAEYLTKVMGYPEENVVTLTGEHAAKSDFQKYIEKWLSNNVEKDSSVFVYYSGHGAPNPKTGDAYLVPYDGDPSFIEETGYPLKRLYAKLDKLPAREIIVILDSCFSGAGGRSVLAKGARPLVMNMDKQVFHSDRIAILSASSGSQISSTHDKEGHGLFTYFLLKGIKEGNSELGTLYNYLKPQVERIARKTYNNEQTPGLIAPKGLLNLRLYEQGGIL